MGPILDPSGQCVGQVKHCRYALAPDVCISLRIKALQPTSRKAPTSHVPAVPNHRSLATGTWTTGLGMFHQGRGFSFLLAISLSLMHAANG